MKATLREKNQNPELLLFRDFIKFAAIGRIALWRVIFFAFMWFVVWRRKEVHIIIDAESDKPAGEQSIEQLRVALL